MKHLSIYLLTCLLFIGSFSSCNDSDEGYYGDDYAGDWYVNDITGNYSLAANCSQQTEAYVMNYFYADQFLFLTGDYLDFSPNGRLYQNQLDGHNKTYHYSFLPEGLYLEGGNIYNTHMAFEGSARALSLYFDEYSLMDYLENDIYYCNDPARRRELENIQYELNGGLIEFYINYELRRDEPSINQVVSGHYYGPLLDFDNFPIYSAASMTFYTSRGGNLNMILDDPLSLDGGPELILEVPQLNIDYGKEAGNYEFWGSSHTNHSYYGPITVSIEGTLFMGVITQATIYIENAGDTYQLYYDEGIRYLFGPENYKSRAISKDAPKSIKPRKIGLHEPLKQKSKHFNGKE